MFDIKILEILGGVKILIGYTCATRDPIMKKDGTNNDKMKSPEKSTVTIRSHLMKVNQYFQKSTNFESAITGQQKNILRLFAAESIRIYKHEIFNSEIVGKIKTNEGIKNVRHLLSASSLAGFTALTRKCINIKDVTDDSQLTAIHPQLKFNKSFDRYSGVTTKSIISFPILYSKAVLGVMQIINKAGGRVFNEQDEAVGKTIAKIIGKKIYKMLLFSPFFSGLR